MLKIKIYLLRSYILRSSFTDVCTVVVAGIVEGALDRDVVDLLDHKDKDVLAWLGWTADARMSTTNSRRRLREGMQRTIWTAY